MGGFKIKTPKINVGRTLLAIGTGGASELYRQPAKDYAGFVKNGGLLGLAGGPGKGDGQSMNLSGGGKPEFAIRKTADFMPNDAAPTLPGNEAISKRFNLMRERAGQSASAGTQQSRDALARRFSAMGGSNSGARIKLEQEAFDQGEQTKNQALEGINQQEQDALLNKDMAQADMDFKQKVFNFERGSKMHELDLTERQQQYEASDNEFNRRVAQEQLKQPKKGFLDNILGVL